MRAQRNLYIASNIISAVTGAYISIHFWLEGPAVRIALGPVSLLFLLIAPVSERLFRIKLGYPLKTALVVFCIAAYNLGVALRWYYTVWYMDNIAHFLSGMLFTAAGFCFYARLSGRYGRRGDALLQAAFAFCFSMAAAVFWEIGEYIGFITIGHDAQHTLDEGVVDTMEDIISCVFGSLVMLADYFVWLKRKRSLIFPMVTSCDDANISK